MAMITSKTIDVNGIRMHVTEAVDSVLLCHGFPETSVIPGGIRW